MRTVALAAAFATVFVATSARAEPAPPRARSYATPLALSYAIPIGVEVAAWTTVALAPQGEPRPGYSSTSEQAGVLVLPTMWISPAIVHVANGQPLRGLVAFAGGLGCTAAGLLVGFPVWEIAASATRDDAHPWGKPAAGSLWAAFGVTAQTLWAVYDVNAHASLPPADAVSARAPSFQLAGAGLAPIRAGAAATARFTF